MPKTFFGGVLPGLPGIFLLSAATIQFLSSKMMAPAVRKAKKEAKKTPEAADDMAAAMQKQMLLYSFQLAREELFSSTLYTFFLRPYFEPSFFYLFLTF